MMNRESVLELMDFFAEYFAELRRLVEKGDPRELEDFFAKSKEKEEAKPAQGPKEKEAEYGTVEIKKVKLGYMTQDLVEVEDGLSEDDMIVVEIQEEFKDKARVEISEVQEGLI